MPYIDLKPIMILRYQNMCVGDNESDYVYFYHMNDGKYLLNNSAQRLLQFDNAAEVCKYIDETYIDATDYYGNQCPYYLFGEQEQALIHFSESKLVSDCKSDTPTYGLFTHRFVLGEDDD